MSLPSGRPFVVIGENLHCTRAIPGSRLGTDAGGREAITFTDADGSPRHLAVPEREKERQAYLEGRVGHVRIALEVAMASGEDAGTAMAYLQSVAAGQAARGADFLDVNVDEISPRPGEAAAAMRWLVEALGGWTELPLSIDSSDLGTIRAGIEAAAGKGAPPMLNSASLERLEALELAAAAGGPVIVTAAGATGMPADAAERVENATRMVEHAVAQGIAEEQIHVDPLVFPVSVDQSYGIHCLDAIRLLRERLGPRVRLTGGFSNVSFGLPARRLLNDAFLLLAIEAGADSGILDPVACSPGQVLAADRGSRPFALALDLLTGRDDRCRAFLKAWRAGELAS